MADVFRFFQVRTPQKGPVRQIAARGISIPADGNALLLRQTAPALASKLAESRPAARVPPLNARLKAAHDEGDLDGFVAAAADFCQKDAILRLADAHPLGQAAYRLFDGMGPILSKPAIERFFREQAGRTKASSDNLSGDVAGEIDRVGDSILALEALRLHGGQTDFSHTRLLRSLYALGIASELRGRSEDWSLTPIDRALQAPIHLPAHLWDLDPCGERRDLVGPAGARQAFQAEGSALVGKMKQVAAFRDGAGAKHDDASCECECDPDCVPQDPCCAKATSFVTDLLIVRETLLNYLPGDIAYIENVLAGEMRSRTHKTLSQAEQTLETETTTVRSDERDLQVSERFDLSSETAKTLNQDSSIQAGVVVNQKWGTGDATLTANASMNTSRSTSETIARNYARDVVDRSVSKIEQNVRQLRSTTSLSRTSETNKHVFDRTGQDLTVGIYAWVNKTMKAQVFSYGRRMVYELVLPEPAALYRATLQRAFKLDEAFSGGEPPPAPPSAAAITAANYLALADAYGIDDAPAPPEPTVLVMANVSDTYGPEQYVLRKLSWVFTGARSQTTQVTVPAGYAAASMTGSAQINFNGRTSTANIVMRIGQVSLVWQKNGANTPGPLALANLEGQLQVVIEAYNITDFSAHLTVTCTPKASTTAAWQGSVHRLFVDAYQKKLDAYTAARAAHDEMMASRKADMQAFIRGRNPFFNRETERTELKRMVISWLTCQFFDRFNAMKQRVQPCGFPQMNLHEAEEEGRIVRFWEQAIDWNLMSYLFYPYFWGRKCTWVDKAVEDTGDGLFDKFMQAGSCRVQAPVAEGFEDLMLYWENTGQIWGQDGEPPLSDSDAHWLSMVEEIKHQQDCYLNDREGRVATTPGLAVIILKGSDRYWDPTAGVVDATAIAGDVDREISIDGIIYRILGIVADPGSPAYDPLNPNGMWWTITLERPCESPAIQEVSYAIGAKFVGAPWLVTVPTNLVWLKNDTECLPSFPMTCGGQ